MTHKVMFITITGKHTIFIILHTSNKISGRGKQLVTIYINYFVISSVITQYINGNIHTVTDVLCTNTE